LKTKKRLTHPKKIMKHLTIVLATLFLLTAAMSLAQTPAEKPIRVLVIDDLSPGYYPMPTATTLRNIIRQDKQFEVVLVEDAEVLGTNLLFDYDVVLLHFKNYREPKRYAAMKVNLEKFVTEGGGLFVYHFACGAFEDWPVYEKLAGRVWDPKKRAHDDYRQFTVQITDKAHPITAGLSDFEIQDELYTCLRDSEVPIHVLAEAVSNVDGKTYPMAFVLDSSNEKVGKGRVFHTTLGHDDKSLTSAGFQTLIKQALIWCANRERRTAIATQEQQDATQARLKEITDSLPEGATLQAYLDCGGTGRLEKGVKIIPPENAKPWTFKPKTPVEIAGVPSQHFTVQFDPARLSFMLEGLDRSKKYQLNVVWWDFDANGRVQSLTVQSPDLSMVRILRPGISLPDFEISGLLAKTVSVMLPLAFVRDGKLTLNVNAESGANVVVSEIWINEVL